MKQTVATLCCAAFGLGWIAPLRDGSDASDGGDVTAFRLDDGTQV